MVESITYRNCIIEIHQDSDPQNPRTEWDNCGTIAAFHKRYSLTDAKAVRTVEEANRIANSREFVSLPIFMYDHSGIALSTNADRFRAFDSAGWDWGQLGIIYMAKSDIFREFGRKRLTKKLIDKVESLLRSEIETFHSYLSGNVFGFITRDYSGDEIDSCWGFYGDPNQSGLVSEAKNSIDAMYRIQGEQQVLPL